MGIVAVCLLSLFWLVASSETAVSAPHSRSQWEHKYVFPPADKIDQHSGVKKDEDEVIYSIVGGESCLVGNVETPTFPLRKNDSEQSVNDIILTIQSVSFTNCIAY